MTALVTQIRTALDKISAEQAQMLTLASFAKMIQSTDRDGINVAVQALVREGCLKEGALYFDIEADQEYELEAKDLDELRAFGKFSHPHTGESVVEKQLYYFWYKEV